MNEHPFTKFLNQLAEDGVPADVDLRSAIHQRLETSKTFSQTGAFSMKTSFARPGRLPVVTLFALFVIAGALIATPQGRAWAQNALRFFTRASDEARPAPALQPTLGAVPTNYPAALPATATPRASAGLPFQETCGSTFYPHCSAAEIREVVDFPVMEVAALPEDWEFSGATGGPELVQLHYQGMAGGLILFQGPDRYADQIDMPIGSEAVIEPVAIGSVTGEYVQGMWVDPGQNTGSVVWDARIPQRTLRWEEGGIRYTLQFMPAKTDEGIELDKAMLVDIAAHVIGEAVAVPAPSPAPDTALDQVASQASFTIHEPGWLPERYAFAKAIYAPDRNAVCLSYNYPGSESAPYLLVAESPQTLSLEDILLPPPFFDGKQIDIPVFTEPILLGGAQDGQALYASNGLDLNTLCQTQDIVTNHVLLWQSGGMSYVISGLMDAYEGRQFVTRLEMRRMAESLTGVSTIAGETPDPEYLPSVEAAEALAGFHIQTPSQMPTDVRFAYAVLRESGAKDWRSMGDGSGTEVILVYLTPATDSIERHYKYLLYRNDRPANTLEEMAMGGGEWVSVHGQPAVFYQVCVDGSVNGGDTACNLNLSWVDEKRMRFDLNAYLPGALDKATFIAIAESIK